MRNGLYQMHPQVLFADLPARLVPIRRWARPLDYLFSVSLIFAGIYVIGSTLSPPQAIMPAPQRSAQAAAAEPTVMPRSVPIRLEIPDIGVSTDLIQLGKNNDGTIATPERYDIAAWYKYSPTPGELGPAVITGHVDNYLGAAVFFRLRELQPEQQIRVIREDGRTAIFRVDRVQLVDQDNFPTDEVYGNISHAGLRLITCGGIYNPVTNRYSHNVVVYASLIES